MAKKCPDCGASRVVKMTHLLVCPACGYHEIPPEIDKGWLQGVVNDTKLWDKSVTTSIPEPIVSQYEEICAAATQGSAYRTLHAAEEFLSLLIRFPVLCAAAVLAEEGIDRLLTEKELTTADWVRIAQAEIVQAGKVPGAMPQPLTEILTKTVSLFLEQGLAEERADMRYRPSREFVETTELCEFIPKTLAYAARYFREIRPFYEELSLAHKKLRGKEGKSQENIVLSLCEFKGSAHPYFLLQQGELSLLEGMHRDRKRSIYRNFTTGLLLERVVPLFRDLYAGSAKAPFAPAYDMTLETAQAQLVRNGALAEFAGAEGFEKWLKSSLQDRGVLLYRAPALSGKTVQCDVLCSPQENNPLRPEGFKTLLYRCEPRTARSVGAFLSGLYHTLMDRPTAPYAEDEISDTLAAQPTLSLDSPGALVAVLQEYKSIFPEEKLLLVMDGLDKIPPKAGDIFACLPRKEDLPEGVFLLLTCRDAVSDDNAPLKAFLEGLGDVTHTVTEKSPEYEAMVKNYIDAHVRLRDGRRFRRLTEEETRRLIQLSEKHIPDIKLYAVLLSEGVTVDELPVRAKLFDAYISAMHERMGKRRFRPAVRTLAAIASAVEPISVTELCGLFKYNSIPKDVMAQLEECAPFLRVVAEGKSVRLTLADPAWADKILGIFPEMIGDVLGHVAMCVIEASEESIDHPSDVIAFCFANIAEYIHTYGNKSMLDVLCKYKVYYRQIKMSKNLFGGKPFALTRRETLLHAALQLLGHAGDRDMLRATTFNTRGNFYTSLCRYRDAREDYTTSVKLGEKCCREFQMTNENILASTYINRGAIHRLLGETDPAVADYARAIELRKRLFRSKRITDEKELAIVYLYYAQTMCDKGEWPQAVENYSNAIEIWEKLYAIGYYKDAYTLASVYYSRAEALHEEGRAFEEVIDYSRAIEVLQKRKTLSFSEKGLLRTLYQCRAELHEELGNSPAAGQDRESAQSL